MDSKRLYGIPNAFGGQDFFDEAGRPVGRSERGIMGDSIYTGTDGSLAGFGSPDLNGSEIVTRPDGSVAGFGTSPLPGGMDFFPADDKPLFGNNSPLFGNDAPSSPFDNDSSSFLNGFSDD